MTLRSKLPGTRDHVLLVVGVSAVIGGGWLFAAPDSLPPQVQAFQQQLIEQVDPTAMAIGIAVGLCAVAALRVLVGSRDGVDRSAITETTPETTNGDDLPSAGAALTNVYGDCLAAFDTPDRIERQVAMYGRRATAADTAPQQAENVLDELAVTARDAYATAENVDADTAAAAIETGAWTDDRTAGAFLATDPGDSYRFQLRERLTAWLAPQRTFENRVEQTVTEIERVAGDYVSFDSQALKGDATVKTTTPTGSD